MKSLRESLFDVDNNIDKIDVELFIKNNFKGEFKVGPKNKDGKYVVDGKEIEVTNKNLTSITNGEFIWNKVEYFDYGKCKVTSLKDMPLNGRVYAGCTEIEFSKEDIRFIQKEIQRAMRDKSIRFDTNWEVYDDEDDEGNYYEYMAGDLIYNNLDIVFKELDGDITCDCIEYCEIEVPESIWRKIMDKYI